VCGLCVGCVWYRGAPLTGQQLGAAQVVDGRHDVAALPVAAGTYATTCQLGLSPRHAPGGAPVSAARVMRVMRSRDLV
jgi:hypothetical protein